jgi:hypothetical protein
LKRLLSRNGGEEVEMWGGGEKEEEEEEEKKRRVVERGAAVVVVEAMHDGLNRSVDGDRVDGGGLCGRTKWRLLLLAWCCSCCRLLPPCKRAAAASRPHRTPSAKARGRRPGTFIICLPRRPV